MPLLTVARYKELAGIEGSEQDPLIARACSQVEKDYLAIRGKAWDRDQAGDPVYPESAEITAFEMALFRMSGHVPEDLGQILFGYPRMIVGSIERYMRAW